MFSLVSPKNHVCNPNKAYLAVAGSPLNHDSLNAYILALTGDGWRFVRENGRAFGCPTKSAEQAVEQARSLGAMVFEGDSLFDFLNDKIKRIV